MAREGKSQWNPESEVHRKMCSKVYLLLYHSQPKIEPCLVCYPYGPKVYKLFLKGQMINNLGFAGHTIYV